MNLRFLIRLDWVFAFSLYTNESNRLILKNDFNGGCNVAENVSMLTHSSIS